MLTTQSTTSRFTKILDLLQDAMLTYQQRHVVPQGSSLDITLSRLTEIERAPGLPAVLHGLVARAKIALRTGADDSYMDFVRAYQELQGQV